MNLAAFVVVTLALTIAVAALSWYLIERPAMTLRRLAMDRAEPRDGESRVIAAGAVARPPAAEGQRP
jgi:peptidoglycan/LPS O-acetylase OafA/YrhL